MKFLHMFCDLRPSEKCFYISVLLCLWYLWAPPAGKHFTAEATLLLTLWAILFAIWEHTHIGKDT
jgi:hypothetical protein